MNMIEKVAREIQQLEGCYDRCNHCKRIAVKCIAAMREPSEEMKRAGFTLCVNTDNMDEIYQAMIDAALKE